MLENGKGTENEPSIDSLPTRLFDPFILYGLHVDLVEPARLVCSMKVPPRLLNKGNFLHGGATASLVDWVGSAAIFTTGAPMSGVSVEIKVSYLDAAYADQEDESIGETGDCNNGSWSLDTGISSLGLYSQDRRPSQQSGFPVGSSCILFSNQ